MLLEIIDTTLEHTSWEGLQRHLHHPRTPWTLCHGDFHAGNMMYVKRDLLAAGTNYANRSLKWFDWTEVGPWEPTTDLAQFIISDVRVEIMKQHVKALLRTYWEELLQLGVSQEEYSFEYCWERFYVGGVERWIRLFVVICGFPDVPATFIQYLHNQIFGFVCLEQPRSAYSF
jgi:aminoglycoside/choline kinase family phosphotransferase